ncbi:MAG: hypothetical protein JWM31_130, partial [Solirubrobacterales bacterium]|nr:hypothetical protein [Solirubrobacterales bacterium]
MRGPLSRYRAAGADPPFADPARAHGTPTEQYRWRLTDPATGQAVLVGCGVHRGRAGATWADVLLADAAPGGAV